jgi:restriction endonuclease Mrr
MSNADNNTGAFPPWGVLLAAGVLAVHWRGALFTGDFGNPETIMAIVTTVMTSTILLIFIGLSLTYGIATGAKWLLSSSWGFNQDRARVKVDRKRKKSESTLDTGSVDVSSRSKDRRKKANRTSTKSSRTSNNESGDSRDVTEKYPPPVGEEVTTGSSQESDNKTASSEAENEDDVIEKLRQLDPYEFEKFVAALWEEMGRETKVEQQSKDGGVDITAKQTQETGDDIVELIQVKRRSEGNTVGEPKVNQYDGVLQKFEADRMVIVTTSSFTSGAEKKGEKRDLTLVDKEDLRRKCREYMDYEKWA